MMRRFLLASLGILALTGALVLQAQEPAKSGNNDQANQAEANKLKDRLTLEEQILARRYGEFEQSLLKLKQRLEKSPNPEHRERAAVLQKALDKARDASLSIRFEQLVSFLKEQKLSSVNQIETAKRESMQLADDLRSILELLRQDNRSADLREKRMTLEQYVKQLEELIRREKAVRAQTELGKTEKAELKNSQGKVAEATAKLSKQMAGDKKGEGGEGKQSKSEAKDAGKGEGKKGESKDGGKAGEAKKGESKDGGKSGQGKEGKQAEAKGGDNKSGQGGEAKQPKAEAKNAGDPKSGAKSGEAKGGEGKQGEAKSGQPKSGQGQPKAGEAKNGDPKSGAKPGEAKAGGEKKPGGQESPKAGGQPKAGEAKSGDPKSGAKAGEAKAGESKGGKASESKSGGQGQPKAGEAKAGDSKSGQGQAKSTNQKLPQQQLDPQSTNPPGKSKDDAKKNDQGGPQQDQPPSEITKARQRIQDSYGNQKDAEKKIEDEKTKEAGKDQEKAIENLEAAKKKLEELLKQLREEELERLLAALQARCERMLAMQIRVYDGTVNVNKQIESNADKKATRLNEQDSLKLSDDEKEIVLEATKAIEMLEAEGSAVAFPEVFTQVREDMKHVQRRLGTVDPGKITQGIEEDVIATLKEMIEALKKARQENEAKKGGQGGPSGPQDQKLLDKIAELKMIRSMQLRVNDRTKMYGRQYEGKEQTNDPNLRREMQDLSSRQERIFEVTNRIAKGDNQ